MSMNTRTLNTNSVATLRTKCHLRQCRKIIFNWICRSGCSVMVVAIVISECMLGSVSFGAVGDQVTFISPEPAIGNHRCSIGLAFDGSLLYFNRCLDPNIYAISAQDGSLREGQSLIEATPNAPSTFKIPELPAAMAYDSKRNGLWIGTQTGRAGCPGRAI